MASLGAGVSGLLCFKELSFSGVVLTHLNLVAQAQCMQQAWEWTPKDIVLHALPLHHMHGITNALITPLTFGAR
jgi:malonyl-CoA/methylmalonyl-CoA synthetase